MKAPSGKGATDGDPRLERILAEASPRARRVLLALGVRSLGDFFRLTRERMVSVRGCWKKTVEEIERLPARAVARQRERIDEFFFQPLSLPPELSPEARRVLEWGRRSKGEGGRPAGRSCSGPFSAGARKPAASGRLRA